MEDFEFGQSLQQAVDDVFEGVPVFLGALIVLLVGYFVAAILRSLTQRSLRRMGFNEFVDDSPAGTITSRMNASPARWVAVVVFWILMLGVVSLAVSLLGIPALTNFVAAIYGYIPNILAAILIFLVASAVTVFATGFVRRVMGDTPTGRILVGGIPAIVMSLAIFMILDQLNIATLIVTITYAAIVGSLALGMALAFGLGGRDVASKLLNDAYEAGLRNAEQAKKDVETAKKRSKAESEKVKRKVRRGRK